MTYLITIQEENPHEKGTLGETTGEPKTLEIYRQRVTELDLAAIIGAINRVPRKTRSDKGKAKQ